MYELQYSQFGFAMKVGVFDIFQFEVRIIYEGFGLAWKKGFRKVETKSSNASLIDIIENDNATHNNLFEFHLIHYLCK